MALLSKASRTADALHDLHAQVEAAAVTSSDSQGVWVRPALVAPRHQRITLARLIAAPAHAH